ncbi:MAG: aldo/keto reductase [Candidatus Heimdallarchaeota archaeon]|nr:aldo/keto reductase [Candidatus Heimdallarchaeota archaeon]
MNYVKFGNTGLKVSPLTLGTMQFGWRVDEAESLKIMNRALELGINTFDTADVYTRWSEESYAGKTEEIIGRWMAEYDTREDLILATKLRGPMSDDINNQGLSRRHVNQAINGSLKRLQTSWVDLYQIHSFDNNTPIEETLHALNLLVDDGIVNYLGASNIHPWMFIESLWKAQEYGYQRFESLQPPYNLARRMIVELRYPEIVKKYNIAIIPYSPLGGGFLTGKYKRGDDLPDTPRSKGVQMRYFSEKRWNILDTVEEIAKVHDAKISQVALAWVCSKDFITSPIIGANTVQQLEENVGALELKLDQDELKRLDEVSDWIPEYEAIR